MKKNYYTTLLFSLLTFLSIGQLDSTFYYNPNGSKHWWHIQKDVISFRCTNNLAYVGTVNPAYVDFQTYWGNDARKMNEIHLNASCSPMNQALILNQIRTSAYFDIFAYAITETPNVPYDINTYYTTDDQILIVFDDLPTPSELTYLEQTYSLDLIHEPSSALPQQGKHTYIFKVNVKKGDLYTSFEMCQQIFENETSMVYSVEPNIYNRDGQTCLVVDEMNLTPAGIQGLWFIRNTGSVVWNFTNGTNDADADICECWSSGYTGQGIKLAVIDAAILEFDHPDLTSIAKAYNVTTPSPTLMTANFTLGVSGHSMNVLGVMGATPNNTSLGQRYAVGSAYNADLYAYIGSSVNSVDIVKSLQEALTDNVDVVNMSFRLPATTALNIELDLHISNGRPSALAPTGFWGTILVAASGNHDLSASNFPANHPNVIGVGGSNPNDYRASSNPPDGEGWTMNSGEGSTYGPPINNYDVVAPMEVIMTTDAVSGGPAGSYAVTKGTSFSSPIVASIAAMILEKNSNLTFVEVRQAIRDGAEKVHPTDYDYNTYPGSPGYNDEMFYGRVSCSNSIGQVTANVNNITSVNTLVVLTGADGNFEILVPESIQQGHLKIYSMDGSLIETLSFDESSHSIPFSLFDKDRGMYLLVLDNKDVIWGMTKVIR